MGSIGATSRAKPSKRDRVLRIGCDEALDMVLIRS